MRNDERTFWVFGDEFFTSSFAHIKISLIINRTISSIIVKIPRDIMFAPTAAVVVVVVVVIAVVVVMVVIIGIDIKFWHK